MDHLNKLFKPGRIGNMQIKNRLVMAPMGLYGAGFTGEINDRIVEYYRARARGGMGLIISGGHLITRECATPHMLAIYDDKYIPGLKQICDAVHEYEAKIAIQIAHTGLMVPGLWAGYERPAYAEAIGPSAVLCVPLGVTPRAISKEEIKNIVVAMGEAARRVKAAGADSVEVHAAHGYMIGAFFSPLKNRRTDEYGGSVENRARFALECLAYTRQVVGRDYPIIFRFNGSDFIAGGTTLEDSLEMAPRFVEAGADALDVTAGVKETPWWDDAVYYRPDGVIVPLAEAIKKVVKVPVIVSGKIGDPVFADRILREGKTDFVGMARALRADPELPLKAKEGRFDDIVRCLYCNDCMRGTRNPAKLLKEGKTQACAVNPSLMREKEFEIVLAVKRKKVVVIGGGPAGIEAAVTLQQRGHDVVLYEKKDRLGGQWHTASRQPEKANFQTLLDRQLRRLGKSGIKVNLNKEADIETVKREQPDAVVMATGSTPRILNIPGAAGNNVAQAIDVFNGDIPAGKRVIVIGGRLRGIEVAHLLARKRKRVSLVTLNRLGEDGSPLERNVFYEAICRLLEDGIPIYEQAEVTSITGTGVYMYYHNELVFLPGDNIVFAVGARPNRELLDQIKSLGGVSEIYSIGDCLEPGYVREAINQGAEVARMI